MTKKNDTRERIILCGFTLFKEKGFNNVTIDDICKKAELTKPSFYYHFSNKNELLYEFLTPNILFSADLLKNTIIADSYWQQFFIISSSGLDHFLNIGSELYSNILKIMLDEKNLKIWHFENDTFDLLRTIIEKSQDAGEIENLSPAHNLIVVTLRLLRGHIFTWCAKESFYDLQSKYLTDLEVLFMVNPKYRLASIRD